MKKLIYSLLLTLTAVCYAQEKPHSAIDMASALNVFIQQYACENIAWQKDIKPIKDESKLEPGCLLGISQFAGKYSYRPIQYEEMTKDARRALLEDPKLKAFLQYMSGHVYGVSKQYAARTSTNWKATNTKPEPKVLTPTSQKDLVAKYAYELTPEDLKSDQIISIRLVPTQPNKDLVNFTKPAEDAPLVLTPATPAP